MSLPKLVENSRKKLSDILLSIGPDFKHLSIATGYWDLAGTSLLIDQLENYESIRLLIGQEPLSPHLANKLHLNLEDSENPFPDGAFKYDLEGLDNNQQTEKLRNTAAKLVKLIKEGRLQVKVFREPKLHAKAYIFGNEQSQNAVGIVGSSNFTKAGLTRNAELNSLENDHRVVQFQPQNDSQEHGYLSWFDELWNDETAVDWTGDFTNIVQSSPVGDLCFGPYDVYIKTLMEVFPDEMVEVTQTLPELKNFLYPFQDQNVHSLRQRLKSHKVAMLSDSVGLGKTITAGSVIKQYLDEGATRIIILPPASLVPQWEEELEGERFRLLKDNDFRVVSQQNADIIQDLIDYGRKRFASKNQIDLIVIDEAHNLRNDGSKRHQQVLELLQDNPDTHVLLLTATPINNRLMDFARQLQLANKGIEPDIKVLWKYNQSQSSQKTQVIPYFEALNRIDSLAKQAEQKGENFNWNDYRSIVAQGLRRFLIRSTRQGAVKSSPELKFPKSKVEQISYEYADDVINQTKSIIDNKVANIFDNINPRNLDLDLASDATQVSCHPIDFFPTLNEKPVLRDAPIDEYGIIPTIFQLVNFIGFTPYRPEIYRHRVYGKPIDDIKTILNSRDSEDRKITVQLSVHNLLHVSWLKRLESSVYALRKSVDYYKNRLELFSKYLNKGYILSLTDASLADDEYADDLERAFDDYERYQRELSEILANGGSDKDLKKYGIRKIAADGQIYNIEQMEKDLERDKNICELLDEILSVLSEPENNVKLKEFVEFIVSATEAQNDGNASIYGKKVLVFSFFADTVKYLERNLADAVGDKIPDFKDKVEFTYGSGKNTEKLARRFAPVSKGYELKEAETEIDFLFATDVLSEGQNLQDAGILVNYDLHWNPVRMIQRNGRINRIGSCYNEVLIANAKPHQDLEIYLRLLRRLEKKIDTIKNSIGTDQSVLGEDENPIEWTDASSYYSDDSETASNAIERANSEEGDVLSWTNDYLLDLKQFLNQHTDEFGKYDAEVKQIKEIPKGKWNYLPKSNANKLKDNETLALYEVSGNFEDSYDKIEDTVFVKVSSGASRGPFSSLNASILDDEVALSLIKTTPDDNMREADKIDFEREKVANIAKEEVRVNSSSDKATFDIKPKMREILEKINPSFEGIILQDLFAKNLVFSNDIRIFKKLINRIDKEYIEIGSPKGTTISEFSKLIQKMQEIDKGKRIIEEVNGVLFYVDGGK